MTHPEHRGLLRRAYPALAFWYAVACGLPVALAAIWNTSETGDTPGKSYVDGRLTGCAGRFGCPSDPAGLDGILLDTAAVLAPSLLVSVPLCAYLARKWRMPALAGFVAAVAGWAALCLGGLVFLGR